MKSDELYIASVSDVHFGHAKTPTRHIVRNWREAFPNAASTWALDAIIIGGDLFDRLLSLNDESIEIILAWAADLLKMAEEHKIHVILMEGTPSHDWGQNKLLLALNRMGLGSQYFHYIDKLSIVYFEDLKSNILFVPDEWRPEPDDTWKEVVELMREQNLDQVDFTILHGVFDYQLPDHVKAPIHVTERYQQITRNHVFGAHVHKPSVRGNVLVNGSFDRLCHGEEEEKGHWRCRYKDGQEPKAQFIVNKGARLYLTVDCTGLELDDAFELLSAVDQHPEGTSIRVKAKKSEPILTSFEVLRKRHPHISWSSKSTDEETVQKNLLVDQRAQYTQIQITAQNIVELTMQRVAEMTTDPAVVERCRQRMREMA